jgi:hypothetical protein
MRALGLAALTVCAAIVALAAQNEVAARYDLAKPMMLKGEVARLGAKEGAPNTYIFLQVAGANGNERWVVEGDAPQVLANAGWRIGSRGATLGLGQVITVVAYPMRAGVAAPAAEGEPVVLEAAKTGRLVRGGDVTLQDGKTMTFSKVK